MGRLITWPIPAWLTRWCWQAAWPWLNLLRVKGDRSLTTLFYALMLPVVLWQASTAYLVGYSPDFVIFTLQIVLGGEILRLFAGKQDLASFRERCAYILSLVALGLTVKLSFGAFGALLLVVMFGLYGLRFKFSLREHRRTWAGWAGLLAVWVLPWLARNLILSGYLLFPLTLISLPFPWRMPDYLAAPVSGVITSWARTRSETIAYTGDWAWFKEWFGKFVFEVKWGFLLSVALIIFNSGFALLFRRRLSKGEKFFREGGLAALGAISLAAVIYWFILAPDYRFSGAVFWTLLVSQVLLALLLLERADFAPSLPGMVLAAVFLLTLWISPDQFSRNLSLRTLVSPPGIAQVAKQYRPADSLVSRTTASGLEVYTPRDAPDCWNAPLPCAPANDYSARLSLIDPGNLQKGFYMQK